MEEAYNQVDQKISKKKFAKFSKIAQKVAK
jgi:hypothetical protein